MDFPHISTTKYYDNDGDAVMIDNSYEPYPPDVEPGLVAGFLIAQNGYTLEDIPRILADRRKAWDKGEAWYVEAFFMMDGIE